MSKLFILKIGGSVVTQKHRATAVVRRQLLRNIGTQLQSFLSQHKNTKLILIHGAGQPGHSLAKRYQLQFGVGDDVHKKQGARLCTTAIAKLHQAVQETFLQTNLPIFSVRTASVVLQKKGSLVHFDTTLISHLLQQGRVPLLSGDMVSDSVQNLSVCSGDTLASYLGATLGAQKIVFASDVDGIFTSDPYIDPQARLVSKICISDLDKQGSIKLTSSHNTDVTGGLLGKVNSFRKVFLQSPKLQEVVIFNGLKSERYLEALQGENTLIATRIKR